MKYVLIRHIGEGLHGSTYVSEDENGKQYLAKVVPKMRGVFSDIYEPSFLMNYHHKNIVSYHDIVVSDHAYILVEELGKCDLVEWSKKMNTLDDIIKCMYDVLCAVNFLHSNGIVHCDIKPNNIISTIDNFKLCDFSVSKFDGPWLRGIACNEKYRPPESWLGQAFSFPLDIWSYGATFYEVLSNESIVEFNSADNAIDFFKTYNRIIIDKRKFLIPCDSSRNSRWMKVLRFIERTFIVDPKDRPTSEDLLKDEIFSPYPSCHNVKRNSPTWDEIYSSIVSRLKPDILTKEIDLACRSITDNIVSRKHLGKLSLINEIALKMGFNFFPDRPDVCQNP